MFIFGFMLLFIVPLLITESKAACDDSPGDGLQAYRADQEKIPGTYYCHGDIILIQIVYPVNCTHLAHVGTATSIHLSPRFSNRFLHVATSC